MSVRPLLMDAVFCCFALPSRTHFTLSFRINFPIPAMYVREANCCSLGHARFVANQHHAIFCRYNRGTILGLFCLDNVNIGCAFYPASGLNANRQVVGNRVARLQHNVRTYLNASAFKLCGRKGKRNRLRELLPRF